MNSRKGILEEYSEITSFLTDEIVKVHKEIHTSIDQIDPSAEYENFIEVYGYVRKEKHKQSFLKLVFSFHNFYSDYCCRSPETKEQNVEFDVSLLEEAENLQANELLWNKLTTDSLQVLWVTIVNDNYYLLLNTTLL